MKAKLRLWRGGKNPMQMEIDMSEGSTFMDQDKGFGLICLGIEGSDPLSPFSKRDLERLALLLQAIETQGEFETQFIEFYDGVNLKKEWVAEMLMKIDGLRDKM